jgi:GT2 family glycosyltransferase
MGELSVSFVLSTMNRCDVLSRTLRQVEACGLSRSDFDVWVVDNASTDGTRAILQRDFPAVNVIALDYNGGGVSRNLAMQKSRGRIVMMIDDDSYPMPGAMRRMLGKFEADSRLGAAVFGVTLPDGREEASAYPNVFIGCGTALRRRALDEVGMLPADFFMQAEEYDLSLRLLDGGWEVQRFDDLWVHHLKTPTARRPARTTRLDVRNNLMLIGRRFPKGERVRFAREWMKRYWWIAGQQGHRRAFVRGCVEGFWRGWVKRVWMRGGSDLTTMPRAMGAEAFAKFSCERAIVEGLRRLKARGAERVLLVEAGKAVGSFVRAAREAGLIVVGIADDRLARAGRRLDGVRVIKLDEARGLAFDVAVLSNLSPAQRKTRRMAFRDATGLDLHDVYEPMSWSAGEGGSPTIETNAA